MGAKNVWEKLVSFKKGLPLLLQAFNKGQQPSQERSQSHPNLKMDKKLAARMDEVDQWNQKSGLALSKFKSLVNWKRAKPEAGGEPVK